MRQKIVILSIIIISILIAIGGYINQDNKKLKTKIDTQIEYLAASRFDGLELLTEKGVYQLRIQSAELSDDIDAYKNKLNTTAHVMYRISKQDDVSEATFHEGLLEMEIWRSNVESDFYLLGNEHHQSSRGFLGQILADFSWKMFNMEAEKRNSDHPIEFGSNMTSTRSSSSYIEDFEIDDFGEITKPGELKYHSVHYNQNLSMTIKAYAYVENVNEPHVIVMEIAKEEGDYHPYWNLDIEQIAQIEFHFKDKYEEKINITDANTIVVFIDYIKSLQFEKFDEQIQNIDEYAYIMMDSYEHNIILSKNGVYTNSNHAVCKGSSFVEDILGIITDN